jgi:Tfp pilus assembly protein PilE
MEKEQNSAKRNTLKNKNENGITLIALVITVIVLIILARN